jgi:sulfur carrier protein
MSKINIKINGNNVEIEKSSTIAQMLKERNVTGNMYVVEKNLKIIQKEEYNQTKIEENDVIEIVGFFGGG